MFITLLGLHVYFASSQVEDYVRCLRGIEDTVSDPQARLATWRFDNTTSGFICDFEGVSCWGRRENRVLGLDLRDAKLSGNKIPEALKYCGKSIQRLDLASDSFTSKIPREICTWMPFLVSIDLSSNKLSGHIPPTIVNCSYLNELVLSNNQLSGSIPSEFGSLNRLKKFSVANNRLSGTIPEIFNGFDREGFEGNSKKNVIIIVAAGVAGVGRSNKFVKLFIKHLTLVINQHSSCY